jgi:tellurite resistance protein TehA-like permease
MAVQEIKKSPQPALTGKYILRWFSPRWFVFIMSTGALANICQMFAGKPSGWLHDLAVFFLMTALITFPAVFFFMALRFFVGLDCILKEWRHSSLIQFYSAISIAAAVCTTGLLNIPLPFLPRDAAFDLAVIFWWVACIVGLFFIFLTPYKIITGDHAEPRRALGFWFLPPVGLFVLVFAGNFLAMRLENPNLVEAILLFNVLVLGVAVLLTPMVYTFFLHRGLFYNFPRKDVAPSFMIGVAPLGVSIIAINTILPVIAKTGLIVEGMAVLSFLVKVVSLLLWGFGLWWLMIAIALTVTYFVRGGIPVTLGYWAFIFPPAAYTIASLIIANTLDLAVIRSVAVVLAALLVFFWSIIFALTVKGIADRSIFDVSPTFKGDIPYL